MNASGMLRVHKHEPVCYTLPMMYYYQHPEADSLQTALVSAEQDKKDWLVELKDTIFYPEGGGQPADKGLLAGQEVLDVQKLENRIFHRVKNKPETKEVFLKLNRPHRDYYSIRHTGQHLLSALLFTLYGIQTRSVHLGKDEVSIEIDRREIREQDILAIEKEAAGIIAENRPIRSFWVKDQEALKAYKTRRPSKTSQNIRLVEIEGLDLTPCGGLHLASTGPLGLIKYGGGEKIRGQLRLKWRIGTSAFEEYRLLQREMRKITTLLAVPPQKAAQRLAEVLKEEQNSLYLLRKAEEREARFLGRELKEAARTKGAVLIQNLEECRISLFKEICRQLSEEEELPFLLTCTAEGRINWILHLPEQEDFDFSRFRDSCLPHIAGKGGGRFPRWQGAGQNPEGLESFFQSVRAFWAANNSLTHDQKKDN